MITKQSQSRITITSVTLVWAVTEWLLWELRRDPYRPPYDMTTTLGTERDLVVYMMGGLALGWIFFLTVNSVRSEFARKDCLYFGLFLAILAAIFGGLVMFPWWPVTPKELLWN